MSPLLCFSVFCRFLRQLRSLYTRFVVETSAVQRAGIFWKQIFNRHGPRQNPLLDAVTHDRLERLPVGLDAVGERIAGDFHDPQEDLIDRGRRVDLAFSETLDVDPLGPGEGVENVRGEVRVRVDDVVPDSFGVADACTTAS